MFPLAILWLTAATYFANIGGLIVDGTSQALHVSSFYVPVPSDSNLLNNFGLYDTFSDAICRTLNVSTPGVPCYRYTGTKALSALYKPKSRVVQLTYYFSCNLPDVNFPPTGTSDLITSTATDDPTWLDTKATLNTFTESVNRDTKFNIHNARREILRAFVKGVSGDTSGVVYASWLTKPYIQYRPYRPEPVWFSCTTCWLPPKYRMFPGIIAIINSFVTPLITKGNTFIIEPTLSATAITTSRVTGACMRFKSTATPTEMLIYAILAISLQMNLVTIFVMYLKNCRSWTPPFLRGVDIRAEIEHQIHAIRNLHFRINPDPYRRVSYTIIIPSVRWAEPYVLMVLSLVQSTLQRRYDLLIQLLTSQWLENAMKGLGLVMLVIIAPLAHCIEKCTDVVVLWVGRHIEEKYYQQQFFAQMRATQRAQEEALFYRRAVEDAEVSKNHDAHLTDQKHHYEMKIKKLSALMQEYREEYAKSCSREGFLLDKMNYWDDEMRERYGRSPLRTGRKWKKFYA